MSTNHGARRDFEHISSVLRDYFDKLDQLHERRTLSGIPTGFTRLDKLTGGLQKSNLIILAARPGAGSTAFALSIAHNAALRYGHAVGVFSLEMSEDQLATRLLCMDSVVDYERLRTGNINDDEWERISDSVARLSGAKIYCDHSTDCTADELGDLAARAVEDHGVELIIVDYLQLLSGVGSLGTRDRRAEILETTRSLKNLARDLDIPVVGLAQLPPTVRSPYEAAPNLEDLRRSGASDEHADLVLLVHRDELYDPATDRPNVADIIVAKHRNGPVGKLNAYFQRFCGRFLDLDILLPNAS